MSSYSRETAIIISIFLFIYGLNEIKRGYFIISGKHYSPTFLEVWKSNISREVVRKDFSEQNTFSKSQLASGYNSFLGGIIFVIGSVSMFLYALTN